MSFGGDAADSVSPASSHCAGTPVVSLGGPGRWSLLRAVSDLRQGAGYIGAYSGQGAALTAAFAARAALPAFVVEVAP